MEIDRDQYIALLEINSKLLSCLEELSEWMREHTGPRDGTLEILTRAAEAIKEAEDSKKGKK